MTVPVYNTTCDIYRAASPVPPAPPDVAGVKCLLNPKGASTLTTQNYTHELLVDPTVDIRDGQDALSQGTNPDKVYVPDKNGTLFLVILVRRKGRGTALDHKWCLLQRQTPSYPTNNL
jgi:hypothetical protein